MKKIKKILIANRGEIAMRIIRAAKELDIRTVSIFSEVDRPSPHVRWSDEAFPLSNNGLEPYLDIQQIVRIAKESKVDAVHPGYGFLSENEIFAQRIDEEGFIFIGPSHETIKMMGDKLHAKETANSAGIPVIPGFEVSNEGAPDIIEKVKSIGFPVLIKARAGGGGKGMHIAHTADQLQEQIAQSAREAKEAFGDGGILVEKLVERPRHVEIQVLADQKGNAVYLFERECSIQRRHQKVIEEAPSTVLDPELREEMGKAALRLVKACNYVNAGTVEFILDQNKKFYFLEMNTRLQVEHPVTEFITGLDLVKQQIWIAEGRPLPFAQSDLKITGHAIELRVYAEDPHNSFLPDVGTLRKYKIAKGIGVRVDDGFEEGMKVPVEYDPLIAKLITHGTDRAEAIARLKRAIDEYTIEGVSNTLAFGKSVMNDEDFCIGKIDTGFIARKLDVFAKENTDATDSMVAAVISAKFVEGQKPVKINNKPILQNKWRERMKR